MKKSLGLTVWQIQPAIAVKANATSAIMSDAIIMGAAAAKIGAVRLAKTVIAVIVGVPILEIAIGMTATIETIEMTAMTVAAIWAVIGTAVQRIIEIVARRIIGTII